MSIGGGGRQPEALPPKWVDLADRVEEVVERVKPKSELVRSCPSAFSAEILADMTHVQSLTSTSYMPSTSFPASKIAAQKSARLTPSPMRLLGSVSPNRLAERPLTPQTRQDFRSTQKYIRQIAELSKTLLSTPLKRGDNAESKRLDLIMAANVQTALATKVQEISGVFRKKQTAYLRRESWRSVVCDSKRLTDVDLSSHSPMDSLLHSESLLSQSSRDMNRALRLSADPTLPPPRRSVKTH